MRIFAPQNSRASQSCLELAIPDYLSIGARLHAMLLWLIATPFALCETDLGASCHGLEN